MDKTINNSKTIFVEKDQLELFPLLQEEKSYRYKKPLSRAEIRRKLISLQKILVIRKRLRAFMVSRKMKKYINYSYIPFKPHILKPDPINYAGRTFKIDPLIIE